KVGVNGAKLSIRARVTEVKGKLSRLYLDRHRARGRWSEIDVRPGLCPENAQCQNFRSHQQDSGPNHSLGAAGSLLDLLARARIGKLPDKKRQDKLCREERNPSLGHGF